MNSGWASDFSYSYYKNLLSVARTNFQTHLFHEVPHLLNSFQRKPMLFLRHDVDLDLDIAMVMAEIESELQIYSTYMVMTNCPFYGLSDSSSKSILLRLKQMGHEVGLHFDFDNHNDRYSDTNIDHFIEKIDKAAKQLEDTISSRVYSISFHRPLQQFLRGPIFIAERVNAYSAELMNWYLSDSKGIWREGEPLPMLMNPQKPVLQLLTHPIWWADKHTIQTERLRSFYDYRTKGLSGELIRIFDDALSNHLGVTRCK